MVNKTLSLHQNRSDLDLLFEDWASQRDDCMAMVLAVLTPGLGGVQAGLEPARQRGREGQNGVEETRGRGMEGEGDGEGENGRDSARGIVRWGGQPTSHD